MSAEFVSQDLTVTDRLAVHVMHLNTFLCRRASGNSRLVLPPGEFRTVRQTKLVLTACCDSGVCGESEFLRKAKAQSSSSLSTHCM